VTAAVSNDPCELYIDLVKKSLTCSLYEGNDGTIYEPQGGWPHALLRSLLSGDVRLVRPVGDEQRADGKDWPVFALTIVGAKQLDNLQHCVLAVLKDGVPRRLYSRWVPRAEAR
jgi:O-methyltransferase